MPNAEKEKLVRDCQLRLIFCKRKLSTCSPAEEREIRGEIKRILASLATQCDKGQRAFVNCIGYKMRYLMNNLCRKELEEEILKFIAELEELIS